MVKNRFLLFGALVCAGLFSACSNEESVEEVTFSGDAKAICEVAPLIDDSDDTEKTRATMQMGLSGMDFVWAANDPITVYTGEENDALTKQTYPMRIDNMPDLGGNVAWFEPAGFALKTGLRYFCLGNAYDPDNPTTGVTSSVSRNSIEVSYAGQRQTENSSTDHLAKYCFLAASDICNSVGHVHFSFQHLGLTLRLVIKGLPAGVEYTNLEMYDGDDFFRQPARRVNLMAGLTPTGGYEPAFEPVDMSLPANKTAPRFSVALGADAEHGISVTASQSLVVYMEIPPVDLTGKTITFHLTSKSGTQDKYCTYKDAVNNGRAFKAGTAVQMTMNVKDSKSLPITLVLHRDWEKFTSIEQTRAIGDPGQDEQFREPKNLYYYICVDGTLWHSGVRTNITWVNDRYSLDPFSIDKANPTVHVYAVASNATLNLLPSVALRTTSESVIKDLYAEITEDADLRDVYSVPYTATNFVGEVKGVDIPLYHVASKLDVQWNAASPISAVSVAGLPTNINVFQPTTHTGIGTGSRSLTTNSGNNTFGRAVFYVPQMANGTYSITTGTKTQDVQFTPNVSDGRTSWMKANLKIED